LLFRFYGYPLRFFGLFFYALRFGPFFRIFSDLFVTLRSGSVRVCLVD
jgi:hypothetical protein